MTHTLSLFVAVALGGSVGAVARFGIYEIVQRDDRYSPWTTFAINLFGALALGLILGFAARRPDTSEWWRTFLTVGVLGAFTTFSTYSADALKLFQDAKPTTALAYLFISAFAGLALCAAGYAAAFAAAK